MVLQPSQWKAGSQLESHSLRRRLAGGKRDRKCSYPLVKLTQCQEVVERGQLPLFGGLCCPMMLIACACRSWPAHLPALARIGESVERHAVRQAALQAGSRQAVSWIEVAAYEAFSHLFIKLMDTPSLLYSSRQGKPRTWPHPNFDSPVNLPQGPTVLTSLLFLLCIWCLGWNPGPSIC